MASTLALALARSVSVELELDILALAHIVDAGEAEPAEGMGDGPALGIEHAVLEGDVNPRLHASRRRSGPIAVYRGRDMSRGPPSGRMPRRRATSW